MMKKASLLILSSLICTSVHADLQALDSAELEQETAISNITAFQSLRSGDELNSPSLYSPGHNELRIQQELNTIDIRILENARNPSVQLENQVLQGPNSGVEINNSNFLNF